MWLSKRVRLSGTGLIELQSSLGWWQGRLLARPRNAAEPDYCGLTASEDAIR